MSCKSPSICYYVVQLPVTANPFPPAGGARRQVGQSVSGSIGGVPSPSVSCSFNSKSQLLPHSASAAKRKSWSISELASRVVWFSLVGFSTVEFSRQELICTWSSSSLSVKSKCKCICVDVNDCVSVFLNLRRQPLVASVK